MPDRTDEKAALLQRLQNMAQEIDPENCILIALSPKDREGKRVAHVYTLVTEAFQEGLISIATGNFEIQKQLRAVHAFLSEVVEQTQVSEFDPSEYL
jgi:hypothetical protein